MTDWFGEAGHEAIHTLDLQQQRIVVTKDADFVDSYLSRGTPAKLLIISAGNLSNSELEQLIRPLIEEMAVQFRSHHLFESSLEGLLIRD